MSCHLQEFKVSSRYRKPRGAECLELWAEGERNTTGPRRVVRGVTGEGSEERGEGRGARGEGRWARGDGD